MSDKTENLDTVLNTVAASPAQDRSDLANTDALNAEKDRNHFEADEMKAGEALFRLPCEFLKGAVSLNDLPTDNRLEVAFAGRSNVGKSSLINALTSRKALARTSNTPGRTRELNYFTIGEDLYLVDMPGYGYARASKDLIQNWTQLIEDYLKGRPQLRRVFLLIDARHGLKDSDRLTMDLMDQMAVSYQIVLTKSDKLKVPALQTTLAKLAHELSKHPAAYPHIIATSARKGHGLDELKATIAGMLKN